MRRTIEKVYPTFQTTRFNACVDDHWLTDDHFPNVIPNRFEQALLRDHAGREVENFIMFDGDVAFPDEGAHCMQDAWFMYDEPVLLNHPSQLRGNVYDGEVDFFVRGPIAMENGSVLHDPNTQRGVRYPYKVATYYPIRNVLLVKGLVHKQPTESVLRLIEWLFEKVKSVGYKYNEKGEALLIGCDPEFTVLDMLDERIRADQLFPTGGEHAIGCDGHAQTGELRPQPAGCPLGLTDNIKNLMTEMAPTIGNDKKVTTGGGGEIDPLGHHIHFNKMISSEELELMDLFVGFPSLNIKGSKRPSGNYSRLGKDALRAQPHGCEYRTPASSLIPELAAALHTTGWCVVTKWESLAEGERFHIEVDDATEIPTLDSYLALDVSPDRRYSPHLEEYWKWVNRIDGREIDPYKDSLHLWVDGRQEVVPQPGIKISWSSNLFPSDEKESFVPDDHFDKIHAVSVFILPTTEDDDGERILQVCIPDDVKARVNMQDLIRLKERYRIAKILGFDHANVRLGLTNGMVESMDGYDNVKQMILDFSRIICL